MQAMSFVEDALFYDKAMSVSDFAMADSALAEIAELERAYKAADEALWDAIEQLQSALDNAVIELQLKDNMIIWVFAVLMDRNGRIDHSAPQRQKASIKSSMTVGFEIRREPSSL